MKFKDYYKILGLETSKVTNHEIKVAYRDAAKKYHPDLNVGDRIAEEKIKDINEAYKILSNAATKKKYDRMWNSSVGRKKKKEENDKNKVDIKFSDFWTMFFGATKEGKKVKKESKKIPVKGENVETKIDLSIEETFYGCEKKISLKATNGKMKTFNVKVPAGIRNNEKIRLIGQGKKGINGGKNGDLLIRINVAEDKQYKLVGYDIYTELNISPWEAVLGAKVEVNAIDETIGVYIPQGIETGEEICIENKGYKDNKGGRGKFIIKIKIMIPKNISEKEKEIYRQLKKVSKFNPREI